MNARAANSMDNPKKTYVVRRSMPSGSEGCPKMGDKNIIHHEIDTLHYDQLNEVNGYER
jgi:hypothetical protein